MQKLKVFLKHCLGKLPKTKKIIQIIIENSHKPLHVRQGGQKKALVLYITLPFKTKKHHEHSNQKEVLVMADVLAEIGFTVDVVDFQSEFVIEYSRYDLLIGFGPAFARSFQDDNFKGKRILHLTGANPNFSNEAEARRCQNLLERRGVLITPRREVYWPWMFSAINSDAIFVLGNSWTLSTYYGINKNTFLVPVPYVAPIDEGAIKRDFSNARYNFCWFAGGGAVHKGLDLLLEAFDEIDENFHLDVCGPIEAEVKFISTYKKSLFANPQITFHGFVDASSYSMKKIMQKNGFVILPSCSEGGGSSVITCMAAGLVPIVTNEASIDIHDFGIKIDSFSVSAIREAIRLAASLNVDDLETRSIKASAHAKSNHSYKSYANALANLIIKIIN